MGNWEDFFIFTLNEVKYMGKEKEFNKMVDVVSNEDKFIYSELRDKWEEALTRIKKNNRE